MAHLGPLALGLAQGCSPGVTDTVIGSTKGGSLSKLTHAFIGRIIFLAGCWLEVSPSSFPCGPPLKRACHNMAAGLIREQMRG